MGMHVVGLVAGLVATAVALPAFAAESRYTPLDLDKCTMLVIDPKDPLQSGIWTCVGLDGIPIYVAEGDLRFLVSFGPNAEDQRAAIQSLNPFNWLGATIEWRIDDAGVPYATILRWFANGANGGEGPTREVLVVTRLGFEVCHIAYVDAQANPEANAMARQAADLFARNFPCWINDPIWVGEGGNF